MSADKEREILDLIMDLVQSARTDNKKLYRETKKKITKLKLDPEYRETVLKMLRPLQDAEVE